MRKTDISMRRSIMSELLKADPKIPNQTAARLLHAEHPDLFGTMDRARNIIRHFTGCRGVHSRENLDPANARQPFTGDAMPLPTPFWDTTPFIFDTTDCLLVCDNHIPFHAEGALELAVKLG